LPEDPVIVDKLQDLFRRLFSDPEQAERFAEDPETVLAEAGIDCEVAELADALPLAVAALPAEQAAAVLERCGPVESWTGLTVSAVLTRVTIEPVPPLSPGSTRSTSPWSIRSRCTSHPNRRRATRRPRTT
jgi:hypothetical protein